MCRNGLDKHYGRAVRYWITGCVVYVWLMTSVVAVIGCSEKSPEAQGKAQQDTVARTEGHDTETPPAEEKPALAVPDSLPPEPVPQAAKEPAARHKGFHTIQSLDEFETILKQSNQNLLVFDLYADWCYPCRLLEPTLDTVARMQHDKAIFYKVNTDKFPMIARAFRIRGIPYVALVKNEKVVSGLSGLRPKDHYLQAIEKFAD